MLVKYIYTVYASYMPVIFKSILYMYSTSTTIYIYIAKYIVVWILRHIASHIAIAS